MLNLLGDIRPDEVLNATMLNVWKNEELILERVRLFRPEAAFVQRSVGRALLPQKKRNAFPPMPSFIKKDHLGLLLWDLVCEKKLKLTRVSEIKGSLEIPLNEIEYEQACRDYILSNEEARQDTRREVQILLSEVSTYGHGAPCYKLTEKGRRSRSAIDDQSGALPSTPGLRLA